MDSHYEGDSVNLIKQDFCSFINYKYDIFLSDLC